MKQNAIQTNLVGRIALISWPIRWKNVVQHFREAQMLETAKTETHFGEYGTVAAVFKDSEHAVKLMLEMPNGELWECYAAHAVEMMPPDFDVIRHARPATTDAESCERNDLKFIGEGPNRYVVVLWGDTAPKVSIGVHARNVLCAEATALNWGRSQWWKDKRTIGVEKVLLVIERLK